VLTEESRFDWSRYPRCVYARSKSSPEEVILSSAATAAIIYPALVLGAGDEKNTLPLLRAVKRGRMRLSPPGSNSGIDVRDLARGISWFIDRDVPGKRVILAGYHFTFRELQTTIAEVLQVAPPWGTMPRALGLPIRWLACGAERLMDQPPLTYEQAFFAFQHRRHDTSRMRALGFQPRYSLRDTITEAARDFSARGLL
jgi:nucleoside-diphosphate-sugar epimerase